ncbi:BRCA1-associated ATM activator 1 isoform X2 [Antennarius striatus]|uniref:BRCA1-associated ATM activator 1 isoform X2 n=1 Tax=Antennarius striatus TaxID=241820 RepID=UPI0035B218D1
MDRECLSLLPGVCEVLADSGRPLLDDTSLEKLLDWFTGLTQSGGSLLKACPCLLELISAVISNASSDPGVLSFTLKLTGLLAASEDGFKILQEASVLDVVFSIQHWKEAGLWEDPCVRIGWIQGLKNFLQHPKALRFFVKSEFIEPLLQLHTDPSLFVASAVNQTLVHILLSFQPDSPAGCHGVNGDDDSCTQTSIRADMFVAISAYLKESLVPTANTELQRSLQTLRLLAQLLAQARPPLRDELLQTVSDTLEELVTAGYSRLTLPMMDVILAAYSCGTDERFPDRRVDRLLTSMLNLDDPSDLIHAAAACLCRGLRHPPHASQAVRILLLPLEMTSGQTLLEACGDDERRRSSIMAHLKRKSSCISMLCVCLMNLQQITLMPPDFLPCPPDVIVAAVLSLLKICRGVSSSSGSSEVCRNIIGSVKVQKCALMALSSSAGLKEKTSDVLTVLIGYLDDPDSDPTVLHKSYQAFVKWTAVLTDACLITNQLRLDLLRVVRKRVCDMRWEVRDSTVEFLGHLADVRLPPNPAQNAHDASEALLGNSCTAPLIRKALEDAEGYVRASAVSALVRTLEPSWQQGAALSAQETETVDQLLEILSQDTEGFSRRAVVRYFTSWFSSCPSPPPPLLMECVRTVLSLGSADLDWEVKVHTLELAELLLDDALQGHAEPSEPLRTSSHPYGVVSDRVHTPHTHSDAPAGGVEWDAAGVLSDLVEGGVVSALLSGLVDCDRPVGLKACRLLMRLRDAIRPLSLGRPDASGVTCKLPAGGWGREIRRILGTKRSCEGSGAAAGLQEVLACLDLDERLDVLTRSSDHVHNSPLSLLQDILSTHSDPDTQGGQEVISDCY